MAACVQNGTRAIFRRDATFRSTGLASKAVREIKAAAAAGDDLDLALKLHSAHETELHLKEKYGSFRPFVENLQIGSYRKVMYLIAMVNDMKQHGYTARELRKLLKKFGTTKVCETLRLLPGYIPPEQLDGMTGPYTVKETQNFYDASKDAQVVFMAQISKERQHKLLKYLERKHGLTLPADPDETKLHGLGAAFSSFIDTLKAKT
jgi:hypothetical protein